MSEQKMRGAGIPFERIRRITGYLTGTVERWNSAKQAELNDRVTHSTGRAINLDALAEPELPRESLAAKLEAAKSKQQNRELVPRNRQMER